MLVGGGSDADRPGGCKGEWGNDEEVWDDGALTHDGSTHRQIWIVLLVEWLVIVDSWERLPLLCSAIAKFLEYVIADLLQAVIKS